MLNPFSSIVKILLVILICFLGGYYVNGVAKNIGSVTSGLNQQHFRTSQNDNYKYFVSNVLPVFEQRCLGNDKKNSVCHTVEHPTGFIAHSLRARAFRACKSCHWQSKEELLKGATKYVSNHPPPLTYDSALTLALHDKIHFSKLLRIPLANLAGGFGLTHKGGEIFRNTASHDYQKLAHWVTMENKYIAFKKHSKENIGVAERYFSEQVLPVFARKNCFAPNCHIFNHSSFILDTGTPTDDLSASIHSRFTNEQIKFNRMASKGLIQSLVYLTGDLEQSRILKKNIPINFGGVLHKAGNDQFFSGCQDPDYQVVKRWLQLEREEALAPLKIQGRPVNKYLVGKVRGVVFVRTPSNNYRHYLDVDKYLPGGDLYLLKLNDGETLETTKNKPINLTKRFRADNERADIREPNVRYDGRSIIFAMRIGEEDNLNIYEISLDEAFDYTEGSFRRLTHGEKFVNGIKIHYTNPVFVPDPVDENATVGGYNLDKADIVFASNISGNVVPSVPRGILGEADGGDHQTIIDLDRPEISGTFVGRKIHIVDGVNKNEWRYIKDFTNHIFDQTKGESFIKVDRPFPWPIDNTSIYVIEEVPDSLPGFLPSYSVYGIKYPEKGKEKWTYDQTISRITHGIGQEMNLGVRSTGEVFFSGQRSFVDKYNRPVFHMSSCRRHLDTRFSFPTHHGNRSQVPIFADNSELPTGIDIHACLDPRTLWESGALSVSDHQLGPNLEARNPNDFTVGLFDENGYPLVEETSTSNTRFIFAKGINFAHPRFLFGNVYLFPQTGPAAVSWTGFSPGGTFRDPTPLPNGDILVSHYNRPINLLDPGANPEFRLYILKPKPSFQTVGAKGFPNIEKIPLQLFCTNEMSDIQPVPVYIRMKEKINAGKRPKSEHLIRYPGNKVDTRPATYLEANYHLIDAIMDNPSPIGKNIASRAYRSIDPIDEIHYVRMVEVLPVNPAEAAVLDKKKIANHDPLSTTISNGIHLRKRILLEQRLEKDGSIKASLPSRTPMIIQSLNVDKMALRQSARLYFFAPNEVFAISPARSQTFQTCGACMGSIAADPQKLFGPSTLFSGEHNIVALNSKQRKTFPQKGFGIDFTKDIQPIFDKNCVVCHNDKFSTVPGFTLQGTPTFYYTRSYESIQQLEERESDAYYRKKYISERNALAVESYLIEKIYGRELKAPRELSGDYPHPSKALLRRYGIMAGHSLTSEEKMCLVRWIDLGATFKGAK